MRVHGRHRSKVGSGSQLVKKIGLRVRVRKPDELENRIGHSVTTKKQKTIFRISNPCLLPCYDPASYPLPWPDWLSGGDTHGVISGSPILLNDRVSSGITFEQPIDVALTLAMADLRGKFIDVETGIVRYGAIRGSEIFERYKDLAGQLKRFNLASLKSNQQRLAFWINIYNTMVIHGVIELGLHRSVKEVPRFFDRLIYEIGGHRFSLNEIEHGILRGNRRHPYRLFRPFRKQDPRIFFAVMPLDPRIHFALVCGARSCPPIGFYEADQIDFQLQLAAASFVNSPQVKILPGKHTLSVSMIFRWYKSDFGGSKDGLMETILQFLDEGESKEYLKRHRAQIRISYQPYDWSLNQ
jgi:hypothetical protein